MLRVTLRGLERDGLVARTVYPESRPGRSTPYSVRRDTATAHSGVGGLGGNHLSEVDAARAAYDAHDGPPARVSVAERVVAKRRTTARR